MTRQKSYHSRKQSVLCEEGGQLVASQASMLSIIFLFLRKLGDGKITFVTTTSDKLFECMQHPPPFWQAQRTIIAWILQQKYNRAERAGSAKLRLQNAVCKTDEWGKFWTTVQKVRLLKCGARDHLNFMFVEFIGLASSALEKKSLLSSLFYPAEWGLWSFFFLLLLLPPPLGNPSFICIVGFRVVKVETV